MRHFSLFDNALSQLGYAILTVATKAKIDRPTPPFEPSTVALSPAETAHAAGLMRVNHVGEICAQALYQGQAWVSQCPKNRDMLLQSAVEELDHLAWTQSRLDELNSHTSRLNPLWYAGAFTLGAVAGKVSEAVSLGFVVETKRQVAAHLDSHLSGVNPLPISDTASRAIVLQMRNEEYEHGEHAAQAGGIELPKLVRLAMTGMAKVMTELAYRI